MRPHNTFSTSHAKSKSAWRLIRKKSEILDRQRELTELARRCGQPGMMQSLGHFLSIPHLNLRSPHKLLDHAIFSRLVSIARTKPPRLLIKEGPNDLEAAALLFEHVICGVSTGIYMPINGEVYRTVVAPPEELATIAREVGEFLIRNGGLVALVSYLEEPGQSPTEFTNLSQPDFWDAEHLVATVLRESSCRLPLKSSFETTLAAMGARGGSGKLNTKEGGGSRLIWPKMA